MAGDLNKAYEKEMARRAARVAKNATEGRSIEDLLKKGVKYGEDAGTRVESLGSDVAKSIEDAGGFRKNLNDVKKTISSSPVNDIGIDPRIKNSKFFSKGGELAEEGLDDIKKLSGGGKSPRFLKMLGKLGLAGVAASMGSKAMAGDFEGAGKEGLREGLGFGVDKALDLATNANPITAAIRHGLTPSELGNDEINDQNRAQMEKDAQDMWAKVRMGQEQERAKAGDLEALTNPDSPQALMREAMKQAPKDNSSRINNSRFKKLLPMLGGE